MKSDKLTVPDGCIQRTSIEAQPSLLPLHILLLSSLYPPHTVGGAELVAQALAVSLVKDGHRVTVVSSCNRSDGETTSEQEGVTVRRFFPKNLWWLYERFTPGDRRSLPAKLRWRMHDLWNRDAARRFGRILDHARPDLVHTHNFKGFSPAIWREAQRRRLPIVHTAHSYELICVSGMLLKATHEVCGARQRCWPCRMQGRWCARHVEAIDIFCSPSRFLLHAHQEAGMKPRRFALVENGMRPPTADKAKMKTGDHAVRFLFLGQLAEHKGVAVLLTALRQLPDAPIVFDVAGRGAMEVGVALRADFDRRLRYHGYVDRTKKAALLSAADVLVMPSIWVENAPVAIAEAFANGVAVIASDLGALPEHVTHEENGLLFPAGNAAALAGCMARLIEEPELLARLKRGARASGRTLATPETMSGNYLSLYRTLANSRRNGIDGQLPISH
jgi:glycosyltransferase involved in cell wall biosynthesis